MNKAELIERIIDTFTDMGSEDPVDTAASGLLNLSEAKLYLDELRANEKEYLEPEEYLPAEITPELYMEAYNCYVRRCQYEVTLARLAEFITLHEAVETYNEFKGIYTSPTDKTVYPTDYLTEDMEFPFTSENLSMLSLITLGQNSPDFKADRDYCWYDEKNEQLHSTDTPFADGLINAKDFAAWVLTSDDIITHVQDFCMVNTDIDYIFRYWRR